MQWLTRKCTTTGSKGIHSAYSHLYIHSVGILYTYCIHVYDVHFCRSELMHTKCMQNVSRNSTNFCIHFVWKIYTKCIQNVYITHFSKRLYTFSIQNLADIVLLILYKKYIPKLVEMWSTFCVHAVYILHTSVIHILCNFCIQNVYAVSVCVGTSQVIQYNVFLDLCFSIW